MSETCRNSDRQATPMPSGFFDAEAARQHCIEQRLALGRKVADVPEAVEKSVTPFLSDRPDIVASTMRAVLKGMAPTLPAPLLFTDDKGNAAVAWLRQACMHVMAARLGATLGDTGRAFGRDRTTVRHAVQLVEAAIEANADTAAFIDFIESQARAVLARIETQEAETGRLPKEVRF